MLVAGDAEVQRGSQDIGVAGKLPNQFPASSRLADTGAAIVAEDKGFGALGFLDRGFYRGKELLAAYKLPLGGRSAAFWWELGFLHDDPTFAATMLAAACVVSSARPQWSSGLVVVWTSGGRPDEVPRLASLTRNDRTSRSARAPFPSISWLRGHQSRTQGVLAGVDWGEIDRYT